MAQRTYGFSFSWRRATGLSAAKGRLARSIGIPLTQGGRDRKLGRLVGSGLGWLGIAIVLLLLARL